MLSLSQLLTLTLTSLFVRLRMFFHEHVVMASRVWQSVIIKGLLVRHQGISKHSQTAIVTQKICHSHKEIHLSQSGDVP